MRRSSRRTRYDAQPTQRWGRRWSIFCTPTNRILELQEAAKAMHALLVSLRGELADAFDEREVVLTSACADLNSRRFPQLS